MRKCRQSENNFALCISAYAHGPVVAKVAHEDYDPNPQYSFAYDVQDSLTGDSKAQHETRSGDVVQGSYSLIDADGFKRTVEYTGTHFSTSIKNSHHAIIIFNSFPKSLLFNSVL